VKTFNRICIEDHTIEGIGRDGEDVSFILKRGKEYLTSTEKDGHVTVFTTYWLRVPVDIFAGERPFTV
jgi:hypothetical protein